MTFSQIEKEMERLMKKAHLSEDHLNLCRDVIRAQLKNKIRMAEQEKIVPHISEEDVENRVGRGSPLVSFDRVKIEKGFLEDLFEDIYVVARKYQKEDTSQIESLKNAKDSGDIDLEDLVKKTISQDAQYFNLLAKKLNIKRDLFLLFGTNIGKPFFELCAENLRDRVNSELWLKGYCPICGNEPAMAKLEKEGGKRILWCQFCSTEWTYRRIRCPFCSNDDHNSLRFFFVEEESPYRVDICDKCKRYIKTVDERKIAEDKKVNLFIENIATLYLDVLADREGYKNPEALTLTESKGGVSASIL